MEYLIKYKTSKKVNKESFEKLKKDKNIKVIEVYKKITKDNLPLVLKKIETETFFLIAFSTIFNFILIVVTLVTNDLIFIYPCLGFIVLYHRLLIDYWEKIKESKVWAFTNIDF